MAVTNCPECGHTISTWTVRCPGCSRIDFKPILYLLLWLAVVAGGCWWWVSKHGLPAGLDAAAWKWPFVQ